MNAELFRFLGCLHHCLIDVLEKLGILTYHFAKQNWCAPSIIGKSCRLLSFLVRAHEISEWLFLPHHWLPCVIQSCDESGPHKSGPAPFCRHWSWLKWCGFATSRSRIARALSDAATPWSLAVPCAWLGGDTVLSALMSNSLSTSFRERCGRFFVAKAWCPPREVPEKEDYPIPCTIIGYRNGVLRLKHDAPGWNADQSHWILLHPTVHPTVSVDSSWFDCHHILLCLVVIQRSLLCFNAIVVLYI